MTKFKTFIIEALFFILILFIIVGEYFQINWLIDNWILLSGFAKFGEIIALFVFPLAFLFIFFDFFVGIKSPFKKTY